MHNQGIDFVGSSARFLPSLQTAAFLLPIHLGGWEREAREKRGRIKEESRRGEREGEGGEKKVFSDLFLSSQEPTLKNSCKFNYFPKVPPISSGIR